MRVWECVFLLVQGACSLCLLRGDACVCGSVCLGLYKAHAHFSCCEAMHAMCGSVCLGLCKAYAHGDCCEAMHACVGVCVWA